MRTAIFAHVDQGGQGLDPLVKEALLQLKEARPQGESTFQGT